jgi:2-oxoisovalerate dehydrogenase E1 component
MDCWVGVWFMDAAEAVHEKFLARLASGRLPDRAGLPDPDAVGLDAATLADIFETQLTSRQMDRLSRTLQARGEGFYTIGSSGHEGNAALAAALRATDMAFLHYRSNAFQLQRARQVPGTTPTWDMLLSFAASAEDPISGGRHKVIGSKPLFIPPQTSTIASHLPKAVGAAFSIPLAKRLKLASEMPGDAIVVATFGDASANHSTAQGAFNTAGWSAFQGSPLPLVFVCEDNGIGISTRTPAGWIAAQFEHRAGLHYVRASGLDIADAWRGASEAAEFARDKKRPVFLHMETVRLYGHAGSDVQLTYLPKAVIEADEERDPLAYGAALMLAGGLMTAAQIAELYQDIGSTLARTAEDAIRRPKLTTRSAVRASLIPPKRNMPATNQPPAEDRSAMFASDAAQMDKPQHMARLISWALADLMLAYPEIAVMGEDVGAKGGVYNCTAKLHARFGSGRVINTLLDEQAILGLAIGMAHNGFVPMPEIQFLAYVHNAEDQIRGEAATLSFFSNGQYTNPMVIRIAGLGYQKGFGGHFHNDNSLAVFRDIPGVILAVPSNGRDAVAMLRESVRLAREEGRVVVFVEPIALYMTRDLHGEGDGLWTSIYEAPGTGKDIRLGQLGVHGDGSDLAIITYGNGYYLSRQAEAVLAADGVRARVIDLRWLAPLDPAAIAAAVGDAARVLIVDECRVTGSQSEALMALCMEHMPGKRTARLAADDCFIPLGKAATVPLPSRDDIVAAARALFV